MENPQTHQYMLLSRLQSDCDYFLGFGIGNIKHLWAGNVPEHIFEMKKLWNELTVKPEWLSFEEILNYEKEMSFINY